MAINESTEFESRVRTHLGRLFAVSAGMVLVLGIVLTGWALISHSRTQSRQLESKGHSIAKLVAAQSVALVAFEDIDSLRKLMEQTCQSLSDCAYAAVVSGGREVIAAIPSTYQPVRKAQSARDGASVSVEYNGSPTQHFAAAIGSSDAPEHLHLGLDLTIHEMQTRSMRNTSLLITLVLLGSCIALVTYLRRSVQRDVTKAASRMTIMSSNLRSLVLDSRDAAVDLDIAAQEILQTSHQQDQMLVEHMSNVEEVFRTMSAITETAKSISERATGIQQISDKTSEQARRGQANLALSVEQVEKIEEKNSGVNDRVQKLYDGSHKVIEVVDIIDDISDRLDLLALNAGLEGTRAGERGRGFSLVAQEMRRLAENVIKSTVAIKSNIEDIQKETRLVFEASDEASQTVRRGVEQIKQTSDALGEIFGLIDASNEATGQITVTTQQQLSSSKQVSAAMEEISVNSSEGISAARATTKAAMELKQLSARLRRNLVKLDLDDNDSSEPQEDGSPGLAAVEEVAGVRRNRDLDMAGVAEEPTRADDVVETGM